MAQAETTEQRRRVARISAHEATRASPNLIMQVKRFVAQADALTRPQQITLANGLSQDWGRLFYGCRADRNRGRFSIYRRSRAQLTALLAELDAALP